jgi:hypothetical protein
MPSRITSVPLPAKGSSPAARHGRGGQHAALECDWAHQELIGGGGVAGGDSSERRRRDHGGAPAAARFPVRLAMGKINTRPWELLWGLGMSYEGLAGGGSLRRCELAAAAAMADRRAAVLTHGSCDGGYL